MYSVNNRFLKLSVMLWLMMYALSAFSASLPSIESKEYKLLLKPSFFKVPSKDYHKFWKIITRVAKSSGLNSLDKEKQYDSRIIAFLDTKESFVAKKNFILRIRADGFETIGGLITRTNGAELTLKYRSPDLASSIIASVSAVTGIGSEVYMEQDKSIKLGEITSVFSKSGEISNPNSIPRTISEVAHYFPGIKHVTFDAKDQLRIVNNTIIIEERIRPGYIYIGDEKVSTMFSIWYKDGSDEPFIAEFSFKIKCSKKEQKKSGAISFPAEKDADKFFLQLAKAVKLYLNDKQTKTSLVYQQVVNEL